MNILFDIGHPGHVHLYRHCIAYLRDAGHRVTVMVKDIPSAKTLLEAYAIEYTGLGRKRDSIIGKGISQMSYNLKAIQLIRRKKISLGVGSSLTLAQVSRFTGIRSILLDDDDDDVQPLFVRYAHPFCDTLLSPESVRGNRGKKGTIFYDGLHELAYLHPDLFRPDPSVLAQAGLNEGDPFFLLRFNVFRAHHDRGVHGLDIEQKISLVNILLKHGKVFITAEREIEPGLEPFKLEIPPEKIHSLMHYATMFIGDSQTMTSEAAVLGVPAIRCNTLVEKISYLNELEKKYELTYGFYPWQFDRMLEWIRELLDNKKLKTIWEKRREALLKDKINTTKFLVWFVENWPESFQIMKKNPEYQERFKMIEYESKSIYRTE